VLLFARSRGRLGVQGARGDSILVDLRDRLNAQGEMPPLPEGWSAEVVLRSAGGASFSGDFLVSTRSDDAQTIEVALVDVSGKGVDAATTVGTVGPVDSVRAISKHQQQLAWPGTSGRNCASSEATAIPAQLQLDAGTRALLLSGAFGGLLGSATPEDFLPSANRYLIRQEWEEGSRRSATP
jgi:hypothetical protein